MKCLYFYVSVLLVFYIDVKMGNKTKILIAVCTLIAGFALLYNKSDTEKQLVDNIKSKETITETTGEKTSSPNSVTIVEKTKVFSKDDGEKYEPEEDKETQTAFYPKKHTEEEFMEFVKNFEKTLKKLYQMTIYLVNKLKKISTIFRKKLKKKQVLKLK